MKIELHLKTWFSLKFLNLEALTLVWNTENKITKDRNGGKVPRLEFKKVILVSCNVDYQQDLRVLYTFVLNKSFGQLLEMLSTDFMFL